MTSQGSAQLPRPESAAQRIVFTVCQCGEGPVEVARFHDPQEQPGAAGGIWSAELAAEGDRGPAVVVGEDLLGQPGEAFGPRH